MTRHISKYSGTGVVMDSVIVRGQQGLTLIELLIAMAISLVIALAAIYALVIARQGFSTVDASSQLRDNGRFAAELVQRLAVQSGFKDTLYAVSKAVKVAGAADPDPNITGFNNAWISTSDPLNESVARVLKEEGYGSDVLILRYQAAETFRGSAVSDGSMIDCAGNSITTIPASRYDRMISIIHIGLYQGEPALMCSYSATGAAPFTTLPIVQGVENFQVLYGTDHVTAGTASTVATGAGTPNAFLRADQITVVSDPAATKNNWRRVRSLRIGMVLRGPLNSAQEKVAQTLYPFGVAKSSDSGTTGSSMGSSDDPGTVFTTPADGRLRQVLTFSVHLRNDQGL